MKLTARIQYQENWIREPSICQFLRSTLQSLKKFHTCVYIEFYLRSFYSPNHCLLRYRSFPRCRCSHCWLCWSHFRFSQLSQRQSLRGKVISYTGPRPITSHLIAVKYRKSLHHPSLPRLLILFQELHFILPPRNIISSYLDLASNSFFFSFYSSLSFFSFLFSSSNRESGYATGLYLILISLYCYRVFLRSRKGEGRRREGRNQDQLTF